MSLIFLLSILNSLYECDSLKLFNPSGDSKNEKSEELFLKSGSVSVSTGLVGVYTLDGAFKLAMILQDKLAKNRRSGIDRRQFFYDIHIPERRSGKDRRR